MCIRDSYDAAQQAVQPDTLARFPIKCTNKLKLPVKDGDKAVSYTHLMATIVYHP